jgi:hypothetical protein
MAMIYIQNCRGCLICTFVSRVVLNAIYRDAQLFSCSIKAKPATYSTKNYFRFERLFTTLKVKMVSVFQRTYRQAERLS